MLEETSVGYMVPPLTQSFLCANTPDHKCFHDYTFKTIL